MEDLQLRLGGDVCMNKYPVYYPAVIFKNHMVHEQTAQLKTSKLLKK